MSAAVRIALSCLPFLGSIVYAWDWINAHAAQGAPFFGPSAVGLLLWLWMVTMGALPLLVGGALSAMLAATLRLRPPATLGVVADRWLTFLGPIVYFAGGWLAWAAMWRLDMPTPTREAPYGPSYFWTIAVNGATWSVVFGAAAWRLVTREARLTPAAAAVP